MRRSPLPERASPRGCQDAQIRSSHGQGGPRGPEVRPGPRLVRRRVPGGPTPAQRLAWPIVAAGENLLLVSPTGTGKTLAAFLESSTGSIPSMPPGRFGRAAVRLRLAAAEPRLRHRAQPCRPARGGPEPARARSVPGHRRRPDGRHLGPRASEAPRRSAAPADHDSREPLAAAQPAELARALEDGRAPHRGRGPRPGADQARRRPGASRSNGSPPGRPATRAGSGCRRPAARPSPSRGSWSGRRGPAGSSRRPSPTGRRRWKSRSSR